MELPQETAPLEKASGNTTKGHPGNREVWGGVKAGTAVGLTHVPAPIYRMHHRDVHRDNMCMRKQMSGGLSVTSRKFTRA